MIDDRLLHQVGQVWQHSEVASAFYRSSHTTLVFQAVTCDTAWQQFALLIDKLEQKLFVFVVNIFDTELAESAVLFATQSDAGIAEEFYIFS
jgi:hypothetical protein